MASELRTTNPERIFVRFPREGSRDAPDNKRKGKLMKLNLRQSLGLAIVSCLGLASSALAAGNGNGHAGGGNSSFGMSQRTDLHTGPGNSEFGRTTAANARLKNSTDADDQDEDDVPKTKKMKSTKQKSTSPGNSAFGRSQRVNHLKGSGNNIYGKTTSAKAKAKHLNKTND